jgi:hypothetical protein
MRRKQVEHFADAMERKLRANDHKGRWDLCSNSYLKRRLRNETRELFAAVDHLRRNKDPLKKHHLMLRVLDEAADVANFAMMIADNNALIEHEPRLASVFGVNVYGDVR